VIDARAGELYYARHRRGPDGVEVVHAPRVVVAAELDGLLAPGSRVLADDDSVRAAGLERRADLVVDRLSRPRALAALELGLARLAARGPDEPSRVEPLYLRAFAARLRRR
jgi:tRNA A37 threonylcarbamoyladenosine modification protein TsaB